MFYDHVNISKLDYFEQKCRILCQMDKIRIIH